MARPRHIVGSARAAFKPFRPHLTLRLYWWPLASFGDDTFGACCLSQNEALPWPYSSNWSFRLTDVRPSHPIDVPFEPPRKCNFQSCLPILCRSYYRYPNLCLKIYVVLLLLSKWLSLSTVRLPLAQTLVEYHFLYYWGLSALCSSPGLKVFRNYFLLFHCLGSVDSQPQQVCYACF